MRRHSILIAALAVFIVGCVPQAKVGKALPVWKEGELDIHFINTGRGESTYQILPDGTTFLVDASGALLAFGQEKSDPLPAKPSADISAGKVIVDYINHFSPAVSKGHINYMLITHFDSDHIGSVKDTLPLHPSGLFLMSSLPEIGSELVIDKLFDRSYPDYSYPVPARKKSDTLKMRNYEAFLKWTRETNGTQVEKWNVGSDSQVTPLHSRNGDVSIRNYSGNGTFWTGEEENTISGMPTAEEFAAMPAEAIPAENAFSCSYILSFGDFDFFLGGDLQFGGGDEYPYKDAEAPVAKAASKVEVMKANHHGTFNANGDDLMPVLCPDVWIVSNWRDVQPRPATIDRVLSANPDCKIFCTNMPEVNIPLLGERMSKIDSHYGHQVIRVASDGKYYMIYTLEDKDEEYIVTSISGPFKCSEQNQ